MKKCPKCGESKSFESFSKNKAKKDGLQSMCRDCKKITDHVHHKNNRDAQNARNKINFLIRANYVNELKSVPCMDCKQTFIPFAMDFDHVRGVKIADISIMVKNCVAMQTLIEEIAKCEVVCAVCHRIRTYNRRMGR